MALLRRRAFCKMASAVKNSNRDWRIELNRGNRVLCKYSWIWITRVQRERKEILELRRFRLIESSNRSSTNKNFDLQKFCNFVDLSTWKKKESSFLSLSSLQIHFIVITQYLKIVEIITVYNSIKTRELL